MTSETESNPDNEVADKRQNGGGQNLQQRLAQPTVRFLLTVVALFVLRFILVRIPGADILVLRPDINVGVVVYGIVTLLIMGAVFTYANTVGRILAEHSGIPDVQRLVQLGTLLALLVWAYNIYFWVPYFADNPEQYNPVFLLIGLLVGIWLAIVFFTNMEMISAKLTETLTKTNTETGSQPESNPGRQEE